MLLWVLVDRFLTSFLVFFFMFSPLAFCDREEFYIVTEAPVAVGGGMIRHYIYREKDLISTRYSFGGVDDDTIYIEKTTRSDSGGSVGKETIELPRKSSSASLQIGSHTVRLKITGRGRIIVRETH